MELPKKNKWISNVIAIIILLFFLVLVVPFPVNKTYDAIEIKVDDPNYLVKRQIKISGTYHINILGSNGFKGRIEVSGYPLTADSERMSGLYSGSDGGAVMMYYYNNGLDYQNRIIWERYTFGMLYSKLFLSRPLILVFAENSSGISSWASRDGYAIVPNVDNFYDAMDVLNDNLYGQQSISSLANRYFARPQCMPMRFWPTKVR